MSGFEIVGIVLGVLPLIISAIEDYEKIIDPVITFKRYSKSLQTFTTELNVQRDIFQNECIWILSRYVDNHGLEDMLEDPSHHLRTTIRNDEKLDANVLKALGPSYRQLRDILILITESLDEIYEETKDLSAGLSRPENPESVDLRAWRHHVKQKLKLSLTKPNLNKKIDDLRHRNQAFLAISQQIARFSTSWSPNQSQQDLHSAEKNLDKVERLRATSKTLYHHLERIWLCPSHSEHSVNLRLCLETSELYIDASSKMSFDMALTYHDEDLPKSQRQGPVLLAVESKIETIGLEGNKGKTVLRFADTKAVEGFDPPKIQRQKSAGLERSEKSEKSEKSGFRKILKKFRSESSSHPSNKTSLMAPSQKSYAFQDPRLQSDKSTRTYSHAGTPAEPTPPDLSSVPDLCKQILESSRPGSANLDGCIGCLSGLGKNKYTIYSRRAERPNLAEMIPLTSMICDGTRSRNLSKSEKWRVAGALSLAVLLYTSTPWLHDAFRSDDILFLASGGPANAKTPHLHSIGSKNRSPRSVRQVSEDEWVKNKTLYCLGITLLEIEFGNRLENLIEWTKLPGSPQLDQPLTRQLQVLKRRSGEQLGTLYGRIVRMCLDCDFGLGLDEYTLQDPRVQKVFYSQVIAQFQERMPEYSKVWSDE